MKRVLHNLLDVFCFRWTVRIKSLKSIFENYTTTIAFFEKITEDHEVDSLISAKAQGFLRSLSSFEFYFILVIIIDIFEKIEILNTELQQKDLCVNESQACVNVVKNNVKLMREESMFSKIWSYANETAADHYVDEPYLKRSRSVPKKLEYSSSNKSHVFSSPEDYYRKIMYYETIDKVLVSLDTRFDNETIDLLDKFERFIGGDKHIKVEEITDFYNIRPQKGNTSTKKVEEEFNAHK